MDCKEFGFHPDVLLEKFFDFKRFPIKTISFKHEQDKSLDKSRSLELFNKVLYYNDKSQPNLNGHSVEKKKTGLIEFNFIMSRLQKPFHWNVLTEDQLLFLFKFVLFFPMNLLIIILF